MATALKITTVDVNGRAVNIHRGGSGRPLLYLHGNDGPDSALAALEKLSRDFDVIAPTHPGFGADLPDWLDGVHDYAYLYLDLIDALELSQPDIVGHSLGGWLALEVAVRCPHAARSVTIAGSAGIHLRNVPKGDPFFWSPDKIIEHLFADRRLVDEWLERERTMTSAQIEQRLRNQRAVARVAWSPPLYNPNLAKWLHRIRVPTHVVWGEQDRMFPIEYAHAFKDLLPRSVLTVMPGCGHLVQVEQTDAFSDHVARFIQELGR
jgi:pimeloyl-ACP methyl ester carboxylesterase